MIAMDLNIGVGLSERDDDVLLCNDGTLFGRMDGPTLDMTVKVNKHK